MYFLYFTSSPSVLYNLSISSIMREFSQLTPNFEEDLHKTLTVDIVGLSSNIFEELIVSLNHEFVGYIMNFSNPFIL